MKKLLESLVEKNKVYAKEGKLASYIPALMEADPEALGVCVVDLKDNYEFWAGDSDVKFTIQSISKVVSLIIALNDNGRTNVFSKVNVEPTGLGFNSIVNLEAAMENRPLDEIR